MSMFNVIMKVTISLDIQLAGTAPVLRTLLVMSASPLPCPQCPLELEMKVHEVGSFT